MMQKLEPKQFDALVADYFSENSSELDQIQLFSSIQSNPEFKSRFNEVNKVRVLSMLPSLQEEKHEHFQKLMQQIQNQKTAETQAPAKTLVMHSTWFSSLRKIAAILVVVLTVSIGSFYGTRQWMKDKNDSIFTETIVPLGSKLKLVLPDGSIAWLNSGSSLKYNQNFSNKTREVILSGEGYFEVKKNTGKPFIVHANAVDVKVLGTIFDVNAYDNDAKVEVNLIQGSVHVALQKGMPGEAVVLKPNERFVYDKQTQTFSTSVKDATKSAQWKTDKLYFENSSLEELAKKLERIYQVKIIIENQQIKKELFSGSINQANTLQEVFSYIDVDKKFVVKQEGNVVRITK